MYKYQWPYPLLYEEYKEIKKELNNLNIRYRFVFPIGVIFVEFLFLRNFIKLILLFQKQNKILYDLLYDPYYMVRPIIKIKNKEDIALFLLIRESIIDKYKR